ncbi:DgyrCDS2500 [Dimorphilus gyrociliatus]|uniref:DgyrCDS2500 n=1 Tax=Dimorphilus gyrociliatus TaxID=2664684 RepID=A0A7I8VDJ0_9ANNE|nr:DgyrCDS2500 [Dimorphilus gyrociliatus]
MNFNKCQSCVNNEAELTKLHRERQVALEELSQCKADKEFVWSLWKRLQIANPDITQAINLVIQREKEKGEEKDKKILQILQNKDEQISSLKNNLNAYSIELNETTSIKQTLQNKILTLSQETEALKFRLQEFEEQNSLKRVEELNRINCNLTEEINNLQSLVKSQSEELVTLENENKELKKSLDELDPKLKRFESSYEQFEIKDKENVESLITLKEEVLRLRAEINNKAIELESCREELKELWNTHTQTTDHASQQSNLIKKLQNLQKDTESVINKQEDAYSQETNSWQQMYNELDNRYRLLMQSESDAQKELRRLKSTLSEKDFNLSSLHKQIKNLCSIVNYDNFAENNDEEVGICTDDLELQVKLLEEKLKEKNRLESEDDTEFPRANSAILEKRIKCLEEKLTNTEDMLSIKREELEELRQAHDRRKERLKSINSQYKLSKKQLKTYEQYEKDMKEQKNSFKALSRPSAASLRKENTKEVWNELGILRKENKNLIMERMNLQEKLDDYKVRGAQDAAALHELRVCLQQEKEELKFQIQQARLEVENRGPPPYLIKRIKDLEEESRSIKLQLDEQQVEVEQLREERNFLIEQSRIHKKEINKAKQEIAEKHIEFINVKKDLTVAQRTIKKLNRRRAMLSSSRNSIHKKQPLAALSRILDDQPTEDEWIDEYIEEQRPIRKEINQKPLKNKRSEDDFMKDKPIKEKQYRSRATSPVTVHEQRSDSKVQKQQTIALKQRISALNKQVSLLKQSRSAVQKSERDLRKQCEALKYDLSLTNQRLNSSKNAVDRLQCDLDRLRADKETLVLKLEEREGSVDESVNTEDMITKSEAEWAMQSARLRAANADITRQSCQIRKLKQELSDQSERSIAANEKNNRLERDLISKRKLLEEFRNKLNKAELQQESRARNSAETEAKIESLTELSSRQKVQIESLKQSLNAANKIRYEAEDKLNKVTNELDKKNRQLSDARKSKNELQTVVKDVENAAESHMKDLASQSESALSNAHRHLKTTENRLAQYQQFIKTFSNELLVSLYENRTALRRKEEDELKKSRKEDDGDEALDKAKKTAAGILNLSHSDLEEILTGNSDIESKESSLCFDSDPKLHEEMRKDQRWMRKVRKLLREKEFAFTLTQAFMEKVSEKCHLTALL